MKCMAMTPEQVVECFLGWLFLLVVLGCLLSLATESTVSDPVTVNQSKE